MCQKDPWGAIVVSMEAHSTQRGQPPRMHGSGLWRDEQKKQRVTPVPLSGGNLNHSKGNLSHSEGNFNQTEGDLNQSKGNLNQSEGNLNQSEGNLNQSEGNLNQS